MPRRNVTVSPREHELLALIADHSKAQSSACLEMSRLRPDQRDMWEKLAVTFKMVEGQVWDLATQGLLSREQADGPSH